MRTEKLLHGLFVNGVTTVSKRCFFNSAFLARDNALDGKHARYFVIEYPFCSWFSAGVCKICVEQSDMVFKNTVIRSLLSKNKLFCGANVLNTPQKASTEVSLCLEKPLTGFHLYCVRTSEVRCTVIVHHRAAISFPFHLFPASARSVRAFMCL